MLTIIGLVVNQLGFLVIIRGVLMNYQLTEKILSVLRGGTWNPGDIWILIGAGLAVVGIVLILINAKWAKDRPYKIKPYRSPYKSRFKSRY